MKKLVFGIMLTLLLTSMLALAFNIQPVKAEPRTWIVDNDGPADFHTIQEAINNANDGDTVFVRNGTYYENVVVDKAVSLVGEDKQTTNIDGNNTGYCARIQSNGVVLENFTIENGNLVDVRVNQNVSQVVIENNFVINSDWGIYLSGSLNSTIEGNLVENCGDAGIFLESSSYNVIIGNTVITNNEGIVLTAAPHIPEVPPVPCRFNTVYHNNLLNNSVQAVSRGVGNLWDDGYPSGGNYWSDYSGTDLFNGPYQNETGSDGIGDAPCGQDEYPLMKPYPWALHDIGITNVTASANTVVQGGNVTINSMMFNYGNCIETLNIALYANDTIIGEINSIELASRNFVIIAFAWNTSGFAKGNYTLIACADPVPEETHIEDNNFTDGYVVVSMVGDLCGTGNAWDFVPDGVVDGSDLSIVAKCYGSWPGAQPPMIWNVNCDVNDDGVVDGSDLAIIARHFGEGGP